MIKELYKMPKEITHILFSDETLEKLKLDKNRLSEIISANLDFFHFEPFVF